MPPTHGHGDPRGGGRLGGRLGGQLGLGPRPAHPVTIAANHQGEPAVLPQRRPRPPGPGPGRARTRTASTGAPEPGAAHDQHRRTPADGLPLDQQPLTTRLRHATARHGTARRGRTTGTSVESGTSHGSDGSARVWPPPLPGADDAQLLAGRAATTLPHRQSHRPHPLRSHCLPLPARHAVARAPEPPPIASPPRPH